MRRLIVNADDLGLTAGVNRAIVEAHRAGIVTDATLMANSPAFGDAVRVACADPSLSVGCHIVLVGGEPLVKREGGSSLVQRDGRLHRSVLRVARAGGKTRDEEIAQEATAQIRKIQNAGITVSHVDSHKHMHMFPWVLKPILRAASACGVRAIRNPYVPARPLALAQLARRPQLWKRYTQALLLRQLGREFRARVAAEGMITTDGTFGIVVTGGLDLDLFQAVLDCVPNGTWEFVCHPGYDDADLVAAGTRLRASRQRELEVFTSPQARVLLVQRDIQLISYRDLVLDAFPQEVAAAGEKRED